MNYRILSKYLGQFSIAIGLLMLPSVLCALWYKEWHTSMALVESLLVSVAVGGLLVALGKNAPRTFYQREALGFVGLAWIVAAGLGGLPYIFSGVLTNPFDAYFESMSGFTTTGSSVMVMEDFKTTPHGIMFWRSFTHWLGGMGIVVLFIAVLPYLGAGGKQLFKSESPGPDPRGLRPRIKDTASILWKIYLGLTVLQTAALMLCGMDLYEALCHTFGTLATGGFSTRGESVAGFNSVAVDVVIIFFMICAGSNFALYFSMLRGNWRAPWKDSEWRWFMAILIVCTIVITLNLMGLEGTFPTGDTPLPAQDRVGLETEGYSFGQALRYASFQVVSIMTTTGYCTDDFNAWPNLSRTLLLVLMFVGGCAGSTGGGLKVVRIIMLMKMAYWRLESTFRPHTIRPIRISGQVVEDDVQRMVYGFFVLYLIWFVGGSLVMSLMGLPFQSALTSVAATLNNIGPGLGAVGADMNYSLIPSAGKAFLSLCMVLGRLELFSICVLFMPSFWRHG